MSELKQVILIRKDLNLSKGKAVAQGAHASCDAVFNANAKLLRNWRESGMKKVVLGVSCLDELERLLEKADASGLVTSKIRDSGKTEVACGTITCGAIGPAPEKKIDMITESLECF